MSSRTDGYVGICDCGEPIIRRTLSGAAPTQCHECRRTNNYGKGKSRGHRQSSDHGPVNQVRTIIREHPHPNVTRQIAAIATSQSTGLSEEMAGIMIDAIDALIEQGESDVQIRRRLNSTQFGRTPTGYESELEALKQEYDL